MDISAFRERRDSTVMTVTEVNNLIKNIFESSPELSSVSIKGEVSNFKRDMRGHLYFSIKDSGAQIRAVMFRASALTLKVMPEDGMKIVARGYISVYPAGGSYQFYAKSIEPDGLGALYAAYEQTKKRLEQEGLFAEENKRPIPAYPERIGVITSPTGAAIRDIISVIGRRYPVAKVYLYPTLVQGQSAEETLIRAVEYFDKSKLVDVVIIGRGGGSIEDLWSFNGEKLARAIYSAKVPIVSAVGHETDYTICDFVSDKRAPTPSAAAEIVVPNIEEIIGEILDCERRCKRSIIEMLTDYRNRLNSVSEKAVIKEPNEIISARRLELSRILEKVGVFYSARISSERSNLAEISGKLSALNPVSVLSRGYSVVTKCGASIKLSRDLTPGDKVNLRFADGSCTATVDNINSAFLKENL